MCEKTKIGKFWEELDEDEDEELFRATQKAVDALFVVLDVDQENDWLGRLHDGFYKKPTLAPGEEDDGYTIVNDG